MIKPAAFDPVQTRARFEEFAQVPGGLLPALHAVQACYGCIDQRAIDLAADVFNFSRAEVYGVVSFYDDFHMERQVEPVFKVCVAEACQAVGGNALKDHALKSANGRVRIEDVFCLGNCACGPSVLANERVHGRMSPARLDALICKLERDGT